MNWKRSWVLSATISILLTAAYDVRANDHVVVDTGQKKCYDNSVEIPFPQPGDPFYGQDAQGVGTLFAFQDNGDGTVTDLNTGLMWQKNPDPFKPSWNQAFNYANALTLAGHNDWRLPTIKELYSIINYSHGWPYIDLYYFECNLDPMDPKNTQYWSSTKYVGLTHGGQPTAFGVNFATGHIKGYPIFMPAFIRCVRGNAYGDNNFIDNGDGTVTDAATGLMWQQVEDGVTRNWEDALAYAESLMLAGHGDWRLPNNKELQSIVDYTHSPNAVNPADRGPAIDTNFFSISALPPGTTLYDPDYGYFWSSTSAYHSPFQPEFYYGWYVAFGTATDDMNHTGVDMHGAGAVRFDAKTEGPPLKERIYNYVRCVRGGIGTSLTADAYTISAATGAAIDITVDAGINNAFRNYLILGSVSGTKPGFLLPGGQATLPLNWDLFTDITLTLVNTSFLQNFHGTLNASGRAKVRLDTCTPLPPDTTGMTLNFAYPLYYPFDFVSNAIAIDIEP